MKRHLLSQAAALCLLVPAASFVTLPAAAAPNAVVATSTAPQALGLEVNADSGVAPGSQLRLTFEGSPGGEASVRIPGASAVVPLREVTPGQYQGRYIVRRSDHIDPSATIRVSLSAGNQTAVANYTFPPSFMAAAPIAVQAPLAATLSQPPVTDNQPPQIVSLMPRFEVGSSVSGAPSAVLPLMVMSHPDNSQVDENLTTIRGRTAPGATVQVRVDAISPVVGRRNSVGVAQQLLSEAVQADANGDFSFSFNPRYTRDNASSLPVPGTRYDISITANRGNQTAESRLMLFQRG